MNLLAAPFLFGDTPPFPSPMTGLYRHAHEDMDAAARRPGEDHQRLVRGPYGHS